MYVNDDIKACFNSKSKHPCQESLYLDAMNNTPERIRTLLLDAGVDERQIRRELAETCDISVQAVGDWFKGATKRISPEYLAAIARRWGTTTDYLITGQHPRPHPAAPSNNEDLVEIPRFDVAGSMGSGLSLPTDYVDVIERMALSRRYLSRTLTFSSLSNLAIITGYGDSMEGTFSDGDLLLVDRGVTDIKIDAVYVLAVGDELYIKRVQRRPDGTLLMLSDNPKYAPYEIRSGEVDRFQVLGRVLLAWNARRL